MTAIAAFGPVDVAANLFSPVLAPPLLSLFPPLLPIIVVAVLLPFPHRICCYLLLLLLLLLLLQLLLLLVLIRERRAMSEPL
jgi:hypothetical protein